MTDDDPTVIRIGLPEVYAQMVSLNDNLVGLRQDMQSLRQTSESTIKTLDDHATRIRTVEHWMWAAPASLLVGVASTILALLLR